MSNLTKKRKKKGFTLVELMAVVAIIAILAVVLVPTVSGYINRAKKTGVITQVRTAVNAIETHNALAGSSKQIDKKSTTVKMTDVVDTIGDNDTLSDSDISKIETMSVAQAYDINSSEDSIKRISVDNDGKFKTLTPKSTGSAQSQSDGNN